MNEQIESPINETPTTVSSMKKTNRITVYACGGGGMSLGQLIDQQSGDSEIFADLDVVYIDTSDSDVTLMEQYDKLYRIKVKKEGDEVNGSGQIRIENAKEIASHVPTILTKHAPGDLSIVLSSFDGATGSVAAPLIWRKLTEQGHLAIVIGVSSRDTLRRLINTKGTIETYLAQAKATGVPPVAYFEEIDETKTRSEVDRSVQSFVACLRVLFSGRNLKSDKRDLFNFIRYNNVSRNPVTLARIHLQNSQSETPDEWDIATVATLAATADQAPYDNTRIEYETIGIVTGKTNSDIPSKLPIHFVITTNGFIGTKRSYEKAIEEIERGLEARQSSADVLSMTGDPDENGLVF